MDARREAGGAVNGDVADPGASPDGAGEPTTRPGTAGERDISPGDALAAGASLPELRVTPDRNVTARYAGASGDFNPIHLDDEFARSVGLPGRILHGLYTMALLARAQTQAAGGPEHLRRLAVQFRGTAVPEEEIAITGTVSAREGSRVTVAATVTQRGKAIIRGATAELDV